MPDSRGGSTATPTDDIDTSDPVHLTVPEALAGQRLDQILSELIPDTSRSRIAQWIKGGRVRVADLKLKPSTTLSEGAVIEVELPTPPPAEAVATPMALVIVYEDDDLVVVDKPAGLVMHPGAGHQDDTLLNGLLARYGELSPVGAPSRPGIVHRIDGQTSGLVVVARTEAAHHHLAAQFAAHTVQRRYRALVWGRALPEDGTFEGWHGRHLHHRVKFTCQHPNGKRAVTHYRGLAEAHGVSWVELQLETGRTHQIRVHMAEANWPLLGDPLYGRPRRIERPVPLRQLGPDLGLKRQALHAFELGFEHPTTGEEMIFESPLPEDMAQALDALGIPS